MSTESATRKKRSTTDAAKRTAEDDHRRKRRNRTTQSCLNCHTSKRMCDRKRPCGRCTQLGLTGLCVYEVDDPTQRPDTQDEASRLQKRVAELESVIRELKNKPHPRWVQSAVLNIDDKTPSEGPIDVACHAGPSTVSMSTPPKSPPRIVTHLTVPEANKQSGHSSPSPLPRSPFLDTASSCSSSSASALGSPSPINTPSPIAHSPFDAPFSIMTDQNTLGSEYDLSSLLSSCHTVDGSAFEDGAFGNIFDRLMTAADVPSLDACHNNSLNEHCGCLHDHSSYNTVLELSLRLRKAADTLSRHARHGPSTNCLMHKGIVELDKFTTSALGNVVSPPELMPYRNQSQARPLPLPSTNTVFTQSMLIPRPAPHSISPNALQSLRAWDIKQSAPYPSPTWEDSFMSWEPPRRQAEYWSQPGGGL